MQTMVVRGGGKKIVRREFIIVIKSNFAQSTSTRGNFRTSDFRILCEKTPRKPIIYFNGWIHYFAFEVTSQRSATIVVTKAE